MAVAFAISIALHEIVAGAVPPNRPDVPAREIVSSVHVLRVAIRRPQRAAPVPRQTITPQPLPSAQKRVARIARRAAPAPRHAYARRTSAHTAGNARPVWDTAIGTAASGTAASGPAQAAAAVGSGTEGNGRAEPSGDQPCGFVTFSDPHGSHFDVQTRGFWVDIRMSVHLADGSSESVILDYPWYYPSEAANPWSDQNLKDPGFPTRFQTPPPGKIGSEPPLVQYVLAHSTPDGMTLLKDCP